MSRFPIGALLALLLWPAIARAERVVVAIAPFRGPSTRPVSESVQRILRPRVTVIPAARFARVARSLFAQGNGAEDIAAVAHELGASFVVTGVTKLDEKRWNLIVTLRDGATGQTMAKLRYPLSSPRVPPSVLRTLKTELIDALQAAVDAPSALPVARPSAKEPPPRWEPPHDKPAPTSPPVRPDEPREPRDPGELRAPAPVAVTTPAPSVVQTGRPKWARWFEVGLGIGLQGRSFATDPPPPRLENGIAPSLHLEGTIYPLAFSWRRARGIFSGLGLGITLDLPFWPAFTTKADLSQRLPATEIRIEGGLRYKLTLYKPLPRPQLTLLVEGGVHQFLFGTSADGSRLVLAPDVRYVYASVGGRFTVHFADWTWIWAQFQYHVVTDGGPIQLQANYGLAATVGFRFGVGLDFLVWRGIRIGAQGGYERFTSRYGYDPNAAQKRDTSTDEYFGGTLVLGYVL